MSKCRLSCFQGWLLPERRHNNTSYKMDAAWSISGWYLHIKNWCLVITSSLFYTSSNYILSVCLWARCEKDLSVCQVIWHSTMGSYVTWLHALSWLCQHGSDGTGAEGRAPWVPQSLPWTRVWDHDTLLAPKSRWASQLQHHPRAAGILLASEWQANNFWKSLQMCDDISFMILILFLTLSIVWGVFGILPSSGDMWAINWQISIAYSVSFTLVVMFGIEPRAFLLLLFLYFPCALLCCEMESNTKGTKIKFLLINIR